MHPLMGLWAHHSQNEEMAGHIVNVPSSYAYCNEHNQYLLIGLLTDDGKIVEVDFMWLVIADPGELRKRVGAALPLPVVAP